MNDIRQLQKYNNNLKKLINDMPIIISELGYKEGEIIVGETKKRTPVNQGLLRAGWHSKVLVKSGFFEIWIINNTEYASYIEKGFKAHFVPGYWSGSKFIYVKYNSSIKDFNKKYPGMYVGNKSTGWQNGKFMMMRGTLYYKQCLMKNRIERFWKNKIKQYLG